MKLPPDRELRAELAALLEKAGEPAAPNTLEFLACHLQLLSRWNVRYKLTSIRTWNTILDRHLRESLMPLRWIEDRGHLLDIGSGNGFPALPILACRPALHAVLAERSEKKCLFLDAVLRETGRSCVRIETKQIGARKGDGAEGEAFDYLISRAALPPSRYLEAAATWLAREGRAFLYASGDAESTCRDRSAHGLGLVHQEPVPGRRDSYLFVLAA